MFDNIEINFLLEGHGKNNVDDNFGISKKLYQAQDSV
jgi:hypothetical protein